MQRCPGHDPSIFRAQATARFARLSFGVPDEMRLIENNTVKVDFKKLAESLVDCVFPLVFGKVSLIDVFDHLLGRITRHDLVVSCQDDVPIAHHLEGCTIAMSSSEDKGFFEKGMLINLAFPLV